MNPKLRAYLRRVESQLSGMDRNERSTVMLEIRDHLSAEVARRVAAGATEDDAVQAAIEAFGEPEDLGVAYGAGGGIVNRTTGDRILEVAVLTGRAAGRGVGKVAKFLGIAALALLGAAVVITVAVVAFAGVFVAAFDDEINQAVPRPVYDRAESHDASDPMIGVQSDSFGIPDAADELRIFYSVEHDPRVGCLRIDLVAPDGDIHNLNGDGCSDAGRHTVYTAEPGTWQVRYTASGFVGDFQVDIMYHV